MTELVVDWCSYEAAKYAVEHWHYSERMPKSKLNKIGVWENGEFIGSVIFGVGANGDLVKRFGLSKFEGCELVRIALKEHDCFVSKIISKSISLLKSHNPELRLIVSYADTEQEHLGIIYQATNWIHTGYSTPADEYIINGVRWHGRSLRNSKPDNLTTWEYAQMLDDDAEKIKGSAKIRYLMPLDRAMRRQIEPLAQPYPKKIETCGRSGEGDTPDDQSGDAGSTPAVRSITPIIANG